MTAIRKCPHRLQSGVCSEHQGPGSVWCTSVADCKTKTDARPKHVANLLAYRNDVRGRQAYIHDLERAEGKPSAQAAWDQYIEKRRLQATHGAMEAGKHTGEGLGSLNEKNGSKGPGAKSC